MFALCKKQTVLQKVNVSYWLPAIKSQSKKANQASHVGQNDPLSAVSSLHVHLCMFVFAQLLLLSNLDIPSWIP